MSATRSFLEWTPLAYRLRHVAGDPYANLRRVLADVDKSRQLKGILEAQQAIFGESDAIERLLTERDLLAGARSKDYLAVRAALARLKVAATMRSIEATRGALARPDGRHRQAAGRPRRPRRRGEVAMTPSPAGASAPASLPLTWYETVEVRSAAVATLAALSAPARKLLAEVVENTGVRRSMASKAVECLENVGFIRIRELDGFFTQDVDLLPTL